MKKRRSDVDESKLEPGPISLLTEVIKTAIDDIKHLKEMQIISQNNEPIATWPTVTNARGYQEPVKILHDYRKRDDVKKLLYFFQGYGLKQIIEQSGIQIEPDQVMKGLGL